MPQRREEKRIQARAELGIGIGETPTPYHYEKTQERAQETIRAEWGVEVSKTAIEERMTPTIYKPANTPTPTKTDPLLKVTIYPTKTPMSGFDDTYTEVLTNPLLARISYYWPPLCGTEADPNSINCDHDLFHTADGSDWIAKVQEGWRIVACPREFPIGTKLLIFGEVWVCLDRGGAIAYAKDFDYFWIDLLVPEMPYGLTWGTYSTIQVVE